MLRTGFPDDGLAGGHLDFSFGAAGSWLGLPYPAAFVLFGDETVGPLLLLSSLAPDPEAGSKRGASPAHGHASDTFRLALRGNLNMGADFFEPGDFRFQEGWKPYGPDSIARGERGGWEALLMADRRGVRMRPVKASSNGSLPSHPIEELMSTWTNWRGDWFDDDNPCGPSGLATTLGPVRGSHERGSFGATSDWLRTDSGSRIVVALLGDPELGAVVVLADTPPNVMATPEFVAGTEAVRIVYRGSASDGERTYREGDVRVDGAGCPIGATAAGPEGLQELIIFGSRREAATLRAHEGWLVDLPDQIVRLRSELGQRNDTRSSRLSQPA